jgi:dTDP-L-rhamnose 4-epimerase
MNILITGGAGFIGSHLRKKLVQNGHKVRILDNLLPQVHGDKPDVDFADVEFALGDVRNPQAVHSAIADMDIVYHLAAETGVGQSQYEIQRYISTNTLGTAVVLEAAINARVKQIIITSSRAVYGEGVHRCRSCKSSFVPRSRSQYDLDQGNWEIKCPDCGAETTAQLMKEDDPNSPISIYGLTKVQQEQIAFQVRLVHPMPVTNLRLFNVFGPGQSLNNPYVGVLGTFFRRISAGQDIDVYEDGQMQRDFVFVDDVAEALMLSAGNERVFDRTINVGSGIAVTLEEAGREMFSVLGSEPKINFSGKYRLGDIHHAVGDIGLLKELLGYVPSTSFSNGLDKFVEWAKKQNRADFRIDQHAENLLKENNLLRQASR